MNGDGLITTGTINNNAGSGIFDPKLGDVFNLLEASSFTGDFSNFLFDGLDAGLTFVHSIVRQGDLEFYRLTVVEAADVPEPTTLSLVPTGLLLLLALRRRNATKR